MKKTLISLIALILVILPSNGILETKKISLQEAIETALASNPQLKMAKIDTQIAQNDIKTANKLQNPAISTYNNIGRFTNGEQHHLGIDYTIELLKRSKRKDVAYSKSLVKYDLQKFLEQSLILEIKKTYIDLLLKKSNLKVIEEQKKLANDLYESALKEQKKGKITKSDLIQTKIALNRTIVYYNIAKSEVIFAQNRFNTVMNTSNINFDTKEDTLERNWAKLYTYNPQNDNLSFYKLKQYALDNRYDLKSAKQEIVTAQKKLEMTKSKKIPDLTFGAGWAYQTKGATPDDSFRSGGYAGASLTNIPLIYQYKPEIENAKLEVEKAQLKYEDMIIDATRNITDAWEKFSIAKDTLNFYDKELMNNSQELLNVAREGLRKNDNDLTSYLFSKKLYFELMLEYQNALGDYYISWAELLRELGATIEDVETL